MDTVFYNINSGNQTLSIIAICVSVISVIISVVVSIVSIKRQENYNRNNVKPFCSIYEANYDNFIFVGIKNDGLGPLELKKIIFDRDDKRSSNSLFNLLPDNIKHTTYHRIYVGELKKRALSVGEKLPLLSITPEDNNIKQQFIDVLKTITVTVIYRDTYNVQERFTKKLEVFNIVPNVRITDDGRKMFF